MRYLKNACLTISVWLILFPTACQNPEAEKDTVFNLKPAFPALTFEKPVDLQATPDQTNRLFVVEQDGRIYSFGNQSNVAIKTLFLDISARVRTEHNEEGLLGLAFHPDFAKNGAFFVNYTASNPRRTVVSRFRTTDAGHLLADPATEDVIIHIEQPYGNHNGGQIAFGPDGYLYIGMGDGGSANDPHGHGQNLKTLLGDLLRLDINRRDGGNNYAIPSDNPYVNHSNGARPEIFASGLRNPWRFSFDKATGRLWVGDVGQNTIEEINIIDKGNNCGWNIMEGSRCFTPASGCNQAGLTLPVFEYDHTEGQSVTGGYVYHGKAMPNFVGYYFFGDFGSGKLWAIQVDPERKVKNHFTTDTHKNISTYGVDSAGELYLCDYYAGKIYRLTE